MVETLLPSNATPLETSLEQAFAWDFEPDDLRGFKFKTEAVPYFFDDLVYEYGLESVSLWLEDSSEILREGLLFQRLRGTPAAMKMALKWTGLEDVIVEEEPAGEHFAEFQLGLEGLPNNFSIDAIKALADMAKPVRARLTRLSNSLYDRRHLILDQNQYGDFLSDYSGPRDASTLQISFGRETKSDVDAALPTLLAVSLKARPIHLAWGEGDGEWTVVPEEDIQASSLMNEVGRRIIDEVVFCEGDENGLLVTPTGRFSATETPTNQLYFHCTFDFEDASTETIRELGIFIGTEVAEECPPGQRYFVPAELTNPGILLVCENTVPLIRTNSTREAFSFVVTL